MKASSSCAGVRRPVLGSGTALSHLVLWNHLFVMAGILVLTSATAKNEEFAKQPCNPACRWPQECNYETSFCECRTTPCNRVVLNGLTWTCQEDVDCAQFAAFSHCVRGTCLCLPAYTATARNKCEFSSVTIEETTTFRSWRPPPTPHGPGPADYSGVVKLALGAAIVMLAGVILALVWNLYRERRRAAQGLSRPPGGRRRRQQAQANSGLPHSHDLPPSYNDIFIISGAEAGRRHEKPPSYEEAMQDQQFAVVAPLAFVNYGFTGEGAPLAPPRGPPSRTSEASGVAATGTPQTGSTNLNWQPSLNVASILNRLGSTPTRLPRSVSDCGPGRSTVPDIVLTECEDAEATNVYPPTNYDGLNVRRTKSGRAPHRRSANDLTRSESTTSVAESCCSTSDVTANVVNIPTESMCENSDDRSQEGVDTLTYSSPLPRNKLSDGSVRLVVRHTANITCDDSPSMPTDGQNSSVDVNKQCVLEGNYLILQNCEKLESAQEFKNSSAPEESEACASASTKVPHASIPSVQESQQTDVSLTMDEGGQHSTADVSFC